MFAIGKIKFFFIYFQNEFNKYFYRVSADTTLFIIKEIYSSMSIQTDDKIPQQTMTIERPLSGGPTPPVSPTS